MGFFVVMACLGGLMGAGLALLLLWAWLRRAKRTPRVLEPPTPVFLSTVRARLRPWQRQAWHDLAARWEGEWTSALPTVTVGQFRGVVLSLHDPQGPGWLAFDMQRPNRRDMRLTLVSSQHHITLQGRFHSLVRGTADLAVHVDGRAWGIVRLPAGWFHRGPIALLDEQGTRRGIFWHQAHRLVRAGWAGRMTIYYGPVLYQGRRLGELACTWVKRPNARQQQARAASYGQPLPAYPAWCEVAEPLQDEEQLWLLTALATEILLNIVVHDDKRIQDGWTPIPGLQVRFQSLDAAQA